MAIFVYMDEAVFEKDGEELFGVGVLISEKQIPENVVTEALEELRNDPDIHEPAIKDMDQLMKKNCYKYN